MMDKNEIIKLTDSKLLELSEELKCVIEDQSSILFKYKLQLKTCNKELEKRELKQSDTNSKWNIADVMQAERPFCIYTKRNSRLCPYHGNCATCSKQMRNGA